jgi:hypothetical protein
MPCSVSGKEFGDARAKKGRIVALRSNEDLTTTLTLTYHILYLIVLLLAGSRKNDGPELTPSLPLGSF